MQLRNLSASPRLVEQMPRVLLISAAVALSACGGGGSTSPTPAPAPAPSPVPNPAPSPGPSPSPSPTNGTVCGSAFLGRAEAIFTFSNCSGCTTASPTDAIDNNRDSSADIAYQGAGGAVTLRVTMQPGVVVPAGRQAGALISFPPTPEVSRSLSIATFLNGVQQESGGGFTNNVASPSTTSTPNFYRFPNNTPYDRIDIVVERNGVAVDDPVRIFEVCSE